MMIGSVKNTVQPPASGTPAAASATSSVATGTSTDGLDAQAASAGEASDRFLKLLVAQMRNQDPLNPLDNAQVTSQMAQISTVQGIEKLNTSMQKWMTQSSAVQQLDGAGLVGRRVLVEGSTIELAGGTERSGVVRGGYSLPSAAAQVRVEVLDSAGNPVASIDRRGMDAGVHSFEWDGRDASGRALPDGRYRLRAVAGEADAMKPIGTLSAASVTAVIASAQGARIELGAAGQRALDDVKGIL